MPGVTSLPSYPVGLTGGRADRTIVGSGRARPGGVEHIWEYNGALLNVRDWYDTFLITSIDGLSDPDVRDSRENNPGRDGETYFQAYYGGRTIVLSGKIRAFSLAKLRDMQMGLKQVFADLSGERPLYVRTGDPSRDVFIYCKKSQPLAMGEVQADFQYTRDFQITLRASNPRFLSYIENRIAYSGASWPELTVPGAGTVQATNLMLNGRAYSDTQAASSGSNGWFKYTNDGTIFDAPISTGVGAIESDYLLPTFYGFKMAGSVGPAVGKYVGVQSVPDKTKIVPGTQYRWQIAFWAAHNPSYNAGVEQSSQVWNFEVDWSWVDFTFTIHHVVTTVPVTLTSNAYGGVAQLVSVLSTAPSQATDVTLRISAANAGTATGPYDMRFGDSMFVSNAAYPSGGDYFDGNSQNGLWNGATFFSSSKLYNPTGFEGKYQVETGGANWYMDTDGWAKPLGGQNQRAQYRSDQVINYTDLQLTFKYKTGALVQGNGTYWISHYIKRLDASNYLAGRLDVSGTSQASTNTTATLKINSVTSAGGDVNLATSSAFTVNANTNYWLRIKILGNVVTLTHWTTDPTVVGNTPAATLSFTLTGANATKFGSGVVSKQFGIRNMLFDIGNDWWWRDHDLDQVVTTSVATITASNEGNAPAQPVYYVYGPLSSTATGGHAFRVGLTRSQSDGTTITQTMYLNSKAGSTLAIPSGNYIVIDSDKRTLKEYDSSGNFVRNSYDQLDISSDWIELLPGDNAVELENMVSGSPVPPVEIRYRHTFF